DSWSLDEVSAAVPADAPLLSVVVPARDEARNIGRLVRSVLASTYPSLELIVVDDHSVDGTARVAREAAGDDGRLRVIPNPPLPGGWFGKQWACATGAREARGDLLLFTDADTEHGPELHARAVNAIRARDADLLTVAGTQEMRSFWERMVQPHPFLLIAARFGGTEQVNRSPHARDKIANGQFILVRRAAYEALDGHALVRDTVAEDLALAQRWFAAGRRTVLVAGERHLRTRMYASLHELVRGWRKNVFAGGREAMRGGGPGRLLFPFLLPLPPLLTLLPLVVLAASLVTSLPHGVVLWAALAAGAQLVVWAAAYRALGHSPLNALGYPLGAAVFLYIVVTATLRGRRVAWKGREYRHA
ncbi:MAG TPA: glycosyltransferase family A protein, partial [Gemmatimonadaceae bacterium]|nr:glycosyltransferase family A protein [Gemmatimonadaceae bacterium]